MSSSEVIVIRNGNQSKMIDSSFQNCSHTIIRSLNHYLTIEKSIFRNNNETIIMADNSILSFDQLEIKDNLQDFGVFNSSSFVLSSIEVLNNKGTINSINSTGSISSCTFGDNIGSGFSSDLSLEISSSNFYST